MSFLVLGIPLLLISVVVFIFGLNYVFRMWEKNQLDNLASGDKTIHKDGETFVSNRKPFKAKSANNDKPLALPGKRLTVQIKEHMLTRGDSEKFVEKMFDKIGDLLFQFRSNSLKALTNLFKYLLSLTKPVEETMLHEEEVGYKHTETEQEPQLSTSEINEPNHIDELYHTTPKHDPFAEMPHKIEKPKTPLQSKAAQDKAIEQATLSLVGDLDGVNSEEMGLFEKMENRILKKLQKSGMSDYDIWLELGDLYVKYNEVKKAMEIYALVLKHSVNEQQKEKAMNKLIGL
jgi:hypothetical protein